MDTFSFSCGEYLQTDKDSDTKFELNCTGGTYEDVEQKCCDCCGADICEDYEYWVEDEQETRLSLIHI